MHGGRGIQTHTHLSSVLCRTTARRPLRIRTPFFEPGSSWRLAVAWPQKLRPGEPLIMEDGHTKESGMN